MASQIAKVCGVGIGLRDTLGKRFPRVDVGEWRVGHREAEEFAQRAPAVVDVVLEQAMLGDGAAHLVNMLVVHVDGVLAVEESPVKRAFPYYHVRYRAAANALRYPLRAPLPHRRIRRVVPLLRVARRQHHLRVRVQPRQLRVEIHRGPVQRRAVPAEDLVPCRRLRVPQLAVMRLLVQLEHVVHIPHAQLRQRLLQRGCAGAAEASPHHLEIHPIFECRANPSLVRRLYLPVSWRAPVWAAHRKTVFFSRKGS